MRSVAIVIPAYNEEKRIGRTLEEYSSFFEKMRKNKFIDYRIIVVINNTTDKTKQVVTSYSLKNKKIDYLDLTRGGKGYAVVEGFKRALESNNDLVGFVDADMATSPEEYWKLINEINNFDGVIADRYLRHSVIHPSPTLQRLIARKLFNFVIRSFLFLPYEDTQCGAKIFKKYAIEKILPNLTMSSWAFDVDLLYAMKKEGFRIKSFPTLWIDKEYSKINFWSAGPWMALAILRLRILHSPFKRFVRIYDKLVGFIPR